MKCNRIYIFGSKLNDFLSVKKGIKNSHIININIGKSKLLQYKNNNTIVNLIFRVQNKNKNKNLSIINCS